MYWEEKEEDNTACIGKKQKTMQCTLGKKTKKYGVYSEEKTLKKKITQPVVERKKTKNTQRVLGRAQIYQNICNGTGTDNYFDKMIK